MNFEHFISVAPVTIRKSLVTDLQAIINEHRGWLNQVSQAAINKLQSLSPHIDDANAERLCSLGVWERKITAAKLEEHPAIKGILANHKAMHRSARDINLLASQSKSCVTYFESFLIEQYNFFSDMNAFLEASVRDQAIFHYSSRMIRSQFADELFTQTVIHLQGLPEGEQHGCVAVVNVDPKRNIERIHGKEGVSKALEEVGGRFKATARQSDSIIEDSENTLIIIFPGMDIQNARSILTRIVEQVTTRPLMINGDSVKSLIAVGAVNIDINDMNGRCMKSARNLCIQAATEGECLKLARIKG